MSKNGVVGAASKAKVWRKLFIEIFSGEDKRGEERRHNVSISRKKMAVIWRR